MPIPGVKVEINPANHSDERRNIIVVSNSSTNDIPVGQVKVLVINQKGGAWLGGERGHYHEYAETYTVAKGAVTFYLQYVDQPEMRQVVEVHEGERLTIPQRVAHKVWAQENAIFVGITEQPYLGSDQDISFEVQATDADR